MARRGGRKAKVGGRKASGGRKATGGRKASGGKKRRGGFWGPILAAAVPSLIQGVTALFSKKKGGMFKAAMKNKRGMNKMTLPAEM